MEVPGYQKRDNDPPIDGIRMIFSLLLSGLSINLKKIAPPVPTGFELALSSPSEKATPPEK